MQRVTTESLPSLELIFFFNVLHLKPGAHPHANRARVSDLFRISSFPICPTNHSLCNNSAFGRPNYSQNSKAPWQESVSHKSKMSSQSGLIPISPVRDNVWQNPRCSPCAWWREVTSFTWQCHCVLLLNQFFFHKTNPLSVLREQIAYQSLAT